MKIKGLKELQNNLKKLESNVKKISGEREIPFNELFDYDFMHKNTNFDSIGEFFRYSEIVINSQEDFLNLDEKILDKAINKFTNFNSWKEMSESALLNYTKREIFEGVKF